MPNAISDSVNNGAEGSRAAYASERMLSDIHDALANLLYDYGGVDRRDVAVHFALPSARFLQTLPEPAYLFSLLDLWENMDLRNSGFVMQRHEDGAHFRSTPRYFDLKYLVSVHAADPEDENQLLSRLLWTLYRYQDFADALLPPEYLQKEWRVTGRLAPTTEGRRPLEIWSDLGVDPRPALLYIVTAPLDIDRAIPSPLVLKRALHIRPFAGEDGIPEPEKEDDALTKREETAPDGGVNPSKGAPFTPRQERIMADGIISYGGFLQTPSGKRLENFEVRLAGVATPETKTDALGRFILHRLNAGGYRLLVFSPDGMERLEQRFVVRSDQASEEHRIVVEMD